MGKDERYAYLKAVKERYHQAAKKSKAIILDEFCQVCGYNRKYAIRLLNRKRKRAKQRPGRKPVYQSEELVLALKRIWLASDQITEPKKNQLQTCHLNLNPFILKQKIELKLKGIFKLIKVTPNVRQRI